MVHPFDRLISFPRYIPDEKGDRKKGDKSYFKIYPLNERYDILKRSYQHLLINDSFLNMEIPEVPKKEVETHFKPEEIMGILREKQNPDVLEQKVIDFSHLIMDRSGVSSLAIGVSGSIMIGLHMISSDMDFIIYGKDESRKIRNVLKRMLIEEDQVRQLNDVEMEKLYRFRGADNLMSFEVFSRHENRKTFQGMFKEQEFFIRYLPDWMEVNEKYGSRRYVSAGYVKMRAIVKDDSESFFSPCKYLLEQVEVIEGLKNQNITEVVSFRGRFCEQAKVGEQVIIQGKLEKVQFFNEEHYRVLLGGKPSDYMISLSL